MRSVDGESGSGEILDNVVSMTSVPHLENICSWNGCVKARNSWH